MCIQGPVVPQIERFHPQDPQYATRLFICLFALMLSSNAAESVPAKQDLEAHIENHFIDDASMFNEALYKQKKQIAKVIHLVKTLVLLSMMALPRMKPSWPCPTPSSATSRSDSSAPALVSMLCVNLVMGQPGWFPQCCSTSTRSWVLQVAPSPRLCLCCQPCRQVILLATRSRLRATCQSRGAKASHARLHV